MKYKNILKANENRYFQIENLMTEIKMRIEALKTNNQEQYKIAI